MMQELLEYFSQKEIFISADGDELVVKAKTGSLTDADRNKLKENKVAVLQYFNLCSQAIMPAKLPLNQQSDSYPLSFVQQRLAIIDKLGGSSSQYNVPAVLELKGELKVDHLETALKYLVIANQQFRMAINYTEGEFKQSLLSSEQFVMATRNLTLVKDSEQQFHQIAITEANRAFDLANDLKLRAVLVQRDTHRYQLLLTFHHIATDGWSTALVIRDLNQFYNDSLSSIVPELQKKPDYTDYVMWQRQHCSKESLQPGIDYWRKRLANAPEVTQLASDRPRGAKATYNGDNLFIRLDAELKEQVRGFCRQNALTEYVFWQGAFLWLNYLYTNEEKQVIGVPMANRPTADLYNIVGFFANTLPFFCEIDKTQKLTEWLRELHKQNAKDMQHQHVPFDWIVDLIPDRFLSVHPIFQLLFVFQNNEAADFDLPGVSVQLQNTFRKTALFDIQLEVQVTDEVQIRWEYNTDLYDRKSVETMAGHYTQLVRLWLKAKIDVRLSDTSLVQTPLNQLRPQPQPLIMTQLEEQLQKGKQQNALHFRLKNEGVWQKLNYKDLLRLVNTVADKLRLLNVSYGDKVALGLPRAAEYVIAVLACMKVGASYVPLDLNQPQSRHENILAVADPVLIICDHHNPLSEHCPVLYVNSLWHEHSATEQKAIAAFPENQGANSDTTLYTIFTSGTTGLPKGVEQTHGAMTNHIDGIKILTPLLAQPLKGAFISATGFDMSFTDIMLPLSNGGELVILEDACRRDMQRFCDEIQNHKIEWLNLPYSLLQMLATHAVSNNLVLNSLTVITSSAEALKITDEIRRFFSLHSECQLVNHYGPTETHVVTGVNLSKDVESWPRLPSIGKEISGVQALIMNELDQVVADGLPGELVIAGHSVASGYWQLEQQTSKKFVQVDLMGTQTRAYRTGDKVYRNSQGELMYMGRLDRQVQFRGYRIELSEVEVVSRQYPGLSQAVAILDPNVGIKLYVVCHEQQSFIPTDVIRYCQMQLPDYMTPVACHTVPNIPLNINGKVDTARLLSGEYDTCQQAQLQQPISDTEEKLLALWQMQLPVSFGDVNVDFFVAGGNSMRIVKLVNEIQNKWDLPFTASHFYLLPTIKLQAAVIELMVQQQITHKKTMQANFGQSEVSRFHTDRAVANLAYCDVVNAVTAWQELVKEQGAAWLNEDNYLLLSLPGKNTEQLHTIFYHHGQALAALAPIIDANSNLRHDVALSMSEHQRSIWVHMSTQCQPALYNMPFAISLAGNIVLPLLQDSLNKVLAKHAALRFIVDDTGSEPTLLVSDSNHWPVTEVNLLHLPKEQRQEQLNCLLLESTSHEFDFYAGCLAKATLVRMTDTENVLIVVVHHLSGDGYSSSLLVDDFLNQIHDAGVSGKSTEMGRPQIVEYAQFVQWQQQFLQSAQGEQARDFWEDYLQGAPVCHSLPQLNYRDTEEQSLEGKRMSKRLSKEQYAKVRQLAAANKITPYTLFNSLFSILLSRYSGEADVVFGTLYAGRPDHRFQNTVGMFANTLPVRANVVLTDTLQDFVAQQAANLQHIEKHQHLPFSQILAVHNPPRASTIMPLCQIMFSWQNFIAENMSLQGIQGQLLDVPLHDCKFELKLDAIEQSEQLLLNWEYRKTLFSDDFVAQMADSLLDMLDAIQWNWQRAVYELPLTGGACASISVGTEMQTQTRQQPKLIDRLLAVASQKPTAKAVISIHGSLDYQQLLQAIYTYAQFLSIAGVESGDAVALYMERCTVMPALYFAIWHIGGTVIPLDKQYPQERVAHILEDADVVLVLTDEAQPGLSALFNVSQRWMACELNSDNGIEQVNSKALPEQLAYILYTSGTTGKPKGVCIEHQQLENFLWSFEEQLSYLVPEGLTRWLWNASPGFDTSLKGFLALAMGAELIVPDDEVVMDMPRLARLIHQYNVPVYNGTVTQFSHLKQHLVESEESKVVNLIIGGESITSKVWQELLEYCEQTQSRCINAYGPTETTINASYSKVIKGSLVNIGGPVVNTTLSVRDSYGQNLPVGAVGELWISGNQVARGYNNANTKELINFVIDDTKNKQKMCYRSGDKVVMTQNDGLIFLGRCDRQIKLRGYRIELAEVEQQCLSFFQVDQAYICVRTIAHQQQLIAYVVGDIDLDLLREWLLKQLPGFMVPSQIIVIEQLPYNQHGKIAENALPEASEGVMDTLIGPETEIEEQLQAIWRSVINLQDIDCRMNFFALGGNSLNAMSVIQQIESMFGVKLKMSAVMKYPNIRSLADHIQQEKDLEFARLLQQVEDMSDDNVAELLQELAER